MVAKLRKEILQLMSEGIQPNEITILTFKSAVNSLLKDLIMIGDSHLKNEPSKSLNEIEWAQVGSFKGLENEYIILIELPDGQLNISRRAELFVGLTRAKTGVHIFTDKENPILRL